MFCIFVFKMFLGILGLLSQTIVNTFIISAFQRGKNVKKEKKVSFTSFLAFLSILTYILVLVFVCYLIRYMSIDTADGA